MASKPPEIVGQVLKDYGEDLKPHDKLCKDIDRWYKAYRGYLPPNAGSAQWNSQLHPPYAFQVIEVLTANVVDPTPGWRVRPRPRIDTPDQIEKLNLGAKANEILLNAQIDNAHFAEQQIFFAKQAFIAGYSVFKNQWQYQKRNQKTQAVESVWTDELGAYVDHMTVKEASQVVSDDPYAEVIDVRDIVFHEGAVSVEACQRITHRTWISFDELKRREKVGAYGVDAGGVPVDDLKDVKDATSLAAGDRESVLFSTNRTKDKIEVLEQWRREPDGSIRVVSVANRAVLLRDTPSPFWHGEFPFVVVAPIPDLGRIPGISVMELMHDNQEALWDLLNQRIDNTRLLNNAVILVRSDYENIEDFEWGPGAQNVVEDINQVKLLEVPELSAQVSLGAEERLKEDIQNIPGASATLLGQSDPSAQTATEISLTTTLAQKRVALMRQQFKWGYKQVAEQWMSLNQQYIRHDRMVMKVGADGADAWERVQPLMLQGDYFIDLESMDQSMIRQERVAEASSRLQVAMSILPAWAAVSQNPAAGVPMLNVKTFMDDLLDAAGISDKDKYYSAAPAPPPQALPPGGGPPGPPQGPPDPSQLGVTAPQATDMNAPSNQFSQSPVAALQQLGAAQGGPANA